MEQLLQLQKRKLTILVATSGDTGGAVAAAFAGRKGIDVKVLFPKNRVSKRQQHQLTCWGGNIEAYEVDGSFDDCQAMVKAAFMDEQSAGNGACPARIRSTSEDFFSDGVLRAWRSPSAGRERKKPLHHTKRKRKEQLERTGQGRWAPRSRSIRLP